MGKNVAKGKIAKKLASKKNKNRFNQYQSSSQSRENEVLIQTQKMTKKVAMIKMSQRPQNSFV